MKSLFSVLLLTTVLLGMAGSQCFGLEVVYPADKTAVTRSNFVIIKGGEKPALESVIIELNGSRTDPIDIGSEEYKAAFKDFLILQPELDPGKNLIKVEGYVKGKKIATAQADCYFQADPNSPVPRSYKPYIMHTPKREALCVGCHNMNPTPAQMSAIPSEHPCAECHSRMLNKKQVHGPAGVFQCDFCHDPDSRPNRYANQGGDADLCNQCHDEQTEKFNANAFVHGPVGAGICSVCHDAHATNNPAQVVLPINDLCLSCHDAIKGQPHVSRGISGEQHPLSGVNNPLQPERELSCASCHNPHGGAGRYFFQGGVTSRFSLCGKCHKK